MFSNVNAIAPSHQDLGEITLQETNPPSERPRDVTGVPIICYVSVANNDLYSPDDADNPIAKVKSDAGESYVCECNGQTFYFDHKPSAGDLCRELLLYEDFVQKLKTMKPWGSEDSLILDYSLSTPTGKVLYNFILFLYE